MEDGARGSHGEDVRGGSAPHTTEQLIGAAVHLDPVVAVIVEDGARGSHGEDVIGEWTLTRTPPSTPHTTEQLTGAAVHLDPVVAVIVEDGARGSHGEDVRGTVTPGRPKMTCSATFIATAHRGPDCTVIVEDGAPVTYGEDVRGGSTPHTTEQLIGGATHRDPFIPLLFKNLDEVARYIIILIALVYPVVGVNYGAEISSWRCSRRYLPGDIKGRGIHAVRPAFPRGQRLSIGKTPAFQKHVFLKDIRTGNIGFDPYWHIQVFGKNQIHDIVGFSRFRVQ